MATNKTNTGIPGVPMAALDAIADENVRQVLRALVDGWHVRNGASGNQESRFLTRGELPELRGYLAGGATGGASSLTIGDPKVRPNDISRVINDLEGQIFSSALWLDLGTRIDDIDLTIVQEQKDRVKAIADEAEARLGFQEVTGSAIASLTETDETHALQIEGLTTRVGDSENTIITLNETTTDHAQQLTSLTSTLGDATSNISVLYETTATTADALTIVTSSLGDVEAALTSEIKTRVSENTAITENITTQIATVGDTISAISDQQTTLANSISAVSDSVSTLQSSVNGFNSKLKTESETRANVDGTMLAKYTVKTDLNGYVAGYGLMSEANNGAVTSSFIVRADAFAIGSPEGPGTPGSPGIAPAIPFIVRTTETTAANGSTIPVGVYMRNAFIENGSIATAHIGVAAIKSAQIDDLAVKTAHIDDLSVNTFKIANNAVTVMNFSSGSSPSTNLDVPANTTMKIVCLAFYSGVAPFLLQGFGALLPETFTMTLNGDTKTSHVGTVFTAIRTGGGGPNATYETKYGFSGAAIVNTATISASNTPARVEASCAHTYGTATIIMLGILK